MCVCVCVEGGGGGSIAINIMGKHIILLPWDHFLNRWYSNLAKFCIKIFRCLYFSVKPGNYLKETNLTLSTQLLDVETCILNYRRNVLSMYRLLCVYMCASACVFIYLCVYMCIPYI